ncbi:hypothetical protein [Streptomyces sp. NPDC088254]|uniref:hypothetical protein n=1 Tax=Streptomyces sp. NPDC088254 TaxID=3365847 RepID=UPI00382BC59A
MTASHHVPGVHTVIGVDAGLENLREADRLIHDLVDGLGLPPGTVACTHLIRCDDGPATAVSLALPDVDAAESVWQQLAGLDRPELSAALADRELGPVKAARTSALAAAEHARRHGGRAVVYPGVDRLTGTVTVADLLGLTAIDRITVIGQPATHGQEPDPATPVLTQDHVRPEWRDGQLTLALLPAAGGALAPFEVPNPTPCCADHT